MNSECSEQKQVSAVMRRGVSFLISVLGHAALVYWMVHATVTIKIYPEDWLVRNVVIGPSEKILMPEDAQGFLEGQTEILPGRSSRITGRETEIRGKPETAPSNLPGSEVAGQLPYPAGEKSAQKAGTEEYSDFGSKFELNLSSKYKTDLPPDYKLDLAPKIGMTGGMPGGKKEGRSIKNIDRLKYLSPGFSTVGPSGAGPYKSYGATRGIQRARASFKVRGYNITPWAEKIVNKVLINWVIPPEQEIGLQGLVGIAAVIEKNGELSSIELVSSSSVQFFDEAAIKSLRMSSPFPQLPDDFPNKNIEAYFEFEIR